MSLLRAWNLKLNDEGWLPKSNKDVFSAFTQVLIKIPSQNVVRVGFRSVATSWMTFMRIFPYFSLPSHHLRACLCEQHSRSQIRFLIKLYFNIKQATWEWWMTIIWCNNCTEHKWPCSVAWYSLDSLMPEKETKNVG
jgi:hypothetical protein